MNNNNFTANNITITPRKISFYMPPITWKGDPVGHIGENDVFFWLTEGEIVLYIDEECYYLKPNQLAFLPKGKKRRYTKITENISLYTMSFIAESDGINLMEGLGLAKSHFVVDIKNSEEMTSFFEKSSYIEFRADPINNVIWITNILNIIKSFSVAFKEQFQANDKKLSEIVDYMKENLNSTIIVDDLANLAHMQPTYFIRRFKKSYGTSPMAYLKSLRINEAFRLLSQNNISVEEVCEALGMYDPSYFSRWFKKSTNISPSEFKKLFSGK